MNSNKIKTYMNEKRLSQKGETASFYFYLRKFPNMGFSGPTFYF